MNITEPINPIPHLPQLILTNGQVKAYLTDCVWEWPNHLIRFHAVIGEGGQQTANALAQALRASHVIHATIPYMQHKKEWGSYPDYKTREWDELVVEEKSVVLHPLMRDKYQKDVVRLNRRTVELVMYTENSTRASQEQQFYLIWPYAFSRERTLDHIYQALNSRCGTIPIARTWTEPTWDWLVQRGHAKQLYSFGRFVGFSVRLIEVDIREFISREIRAGRLAFSGHTEEKKVA